MNIRLNVALILSIVFAVGLVALAFTFYQISTERNKLHSELEYRTSHLVDDFCRNNTVCLQQANALQVESLIDSVSNQHAILGLAIFYNKDSLITSNNTIHGIVNHSVDFITQTIIAGTSAGSFTTVKNKNVFQYVRLLKHQDSSSYAVVFYTDATYIDNIINGIWFRNFIRWFLQALFVYVITMLVIKWIIFVPINKIVEWVKSARSGNIEKLGENPPAYFLAPLHTEIVKIAKAMHEAKATANEEARLRSSSEAVWTPERLKIEVENLLPDKKMIVVSNREPYMHVYEGKEMRCIVPASGLITAMEPILKACGGLWLASGSGDADKEAVDENNKVMVPPDEPCYTLKRLWLTKEEEDRYYYGFSNEGLWPLCHIAHTRPVFRVEDWDCYKKVNESFARSVLAETANEDEPFVLIQDYHFALLPELIRKKKPNARIAVFWHIPWPNPESFGICPWQKEILLGMLGADLIGFHTQYHCNHFLETVNSSLESRVIWDNFSVKINEKTTLVKPFPISIAFTLKDLDKQPSPVNLSQLLNNYGITARFMGIGVDRIDYTKGIIEKFLAIERFLERNPSYVGKFTFVQVGAPSRTLLKSYADIISAVENEANRINWRFKSKNWKAILLLKRHHSHEEIAPFYESADLCMVTSLHDGMNLVAKEFVSARSNNSGVLILSRFAGASTELHGALIVNPYDIEKMANAIKSALEMPKEQQQQRMTQMRQIIVENNIYLWAANLLRTMASIKK